MPAPASSPRTEPARGSLDSPLIDIAGLLFVLAVSPLSARACSAALGSISFMSAWHARFEPNAAISFCLAFVVLDYAQYWSHRLMHTPGPWRLHLLHHTVTRMNGLAAMRHSLGEVVLTPTLWLHLLVLSCLKEPTYYLMGINTGLVLDVWRHSAWLAPADHGVARWLRVLLVTPEQHALHHASHEHGVNFGANFSLWDRLHGTYRAPPREVLPLGAATRDTPSRLLLWIASTHDAHDVGERATTTSDAHVRYRGVAAIAWWAVQTFAIGAAVLCAFDWAAPSVSTTTWLSTLGGKHVLGMIPVACTLLFVLAHRMTVPAGERLSQAPANVMRDQGFAFAALLVFAACVAGMLTRVQADTTVSARFMLTCVVFTALVTVTLATRALLTTLGSLSAALRKTSVQIALVGFAGASLATHLSDHAVPALRELTVDLVRLVIHALLTNVTSDAGLYAVGTAKFRARIGAPCSGIEGISLAAAMLVPYLWVSRGTLRFPRALWLFPVVLTAMVGVNVLRIVLLILYGQVHTQEATDAFHSGLGWFSFTLVFALVVPSTERVLHLGREEASPHAARLRNSSVPYLLPLTASLGAALVVTMLHLDATPLSMLRYFAAALVLSIVYRERPSFSGTHVPAALATGTCVAIVWIYTARAPSIATAAGLHDPRNWVGVVHIIGYALLTPLIEELAFRGFLMRFVDKIRFEEISLASVTPFAMSVSSFFFGALHPRYFAAGLAGLAFAAVAKRSNSLAPAILAHASANMLILLYALTTGRFDLIG